MSAVALSYYFCLIVTTSTVLIDSSRQCTGTTFSARLVSITKEAQAQDSEWLKRAKAFIGLRYCFSWIPLEVRLALCQSSFS